MLTAYLFDDGQGLLSPLTDLRAVFEVRLGALSLLERLGLDDRLTLAGVFVPEGLAPLIAERLALPVNPPVRAGGSAWLINGRWALCEVGDVATLARGEVAVGPEHQAVLAAHVDGADVPQVMAGDLTGLRVTVWNRPHHRLLSRPWHVRTVRDQVLARDLSTLLSRSGHGAVHPTAQVHRSAVLDGEQGPVVLAEHATVRAGAIVIGPAYVGPHAAVLERALIRGGTAIGPRCKVAGEIAGTVFQGCSNKAHEGFLGDSWVGEWVNLGAGTTNSNLLNTYGEVIARATPDGPRERTGEQFLGAIIGDHVKTAIGTRIMTGAVIGTGTMWAATAPIHGCIPPFTWATDAGVQVHRLTRFLETARAMMARRAVRPGEAYEQRLAWLHGRAQRYFRGGSADQTAVGSEQPDRKSAGGSLPADRSGQA